MENKKERIVSKKTAKSYFTTTGLILTIYALVVLLFPNLLNIFLTYTNSTVLNDPILHYGIHFIILLIGTFIPFVLLKAVSKYKTKRIFRSVKVTFKELFFQTIVFFSLCAALTFISTTLLNNLGFEGGLLSGIGLSYADENLYNPLFVIMLIVVSPIMEEFAFRGVLLHGLGKYGKKFALVASSIIFALAHSTVAEIIPAFAMGYFLGKISLSYKSIQPSIFIHILFNAFIYGLCILPSKIAQYMSYAIALMCVFAIYLVLTKRFKSIKVQALRSNRLTNILFYTRPTIIFTFILMLINFGLFYLSKNYSIIETFLLK